MKNILGEARQLKEEARTYIALAQKANGKEQRDSLFKEALDVLQEAIEILKDELDNLKEVQEKNSLLEAQCSDLAAEMADCLGIAGGTYRKWGLLPEAIKMYDQGCLYEEDSTYLIQSSYNMVNSIVLRVTEDITSLTSLKKRIETAIHVVRKQINSSREKDWWAWADLGLLYVLSEADELAIEVYRKIKDLGAKEDHITSISSVLKQLGLQIEESYPSIADLIQQCIVVLKKEN